MKLYLKKTIDQGKIIEKISKEKLEFEELKDTYDHQTETFHELFQKGIIDRNGKIVDTCME